MSAKSNTTSPPKLWELPEVLLYHISSYIAAPAHRAHVICHQLAPLCRQSHVFLLQSDRSVILWDAILEGDYGVVVKHQQQQRRSCKRLRRTPVHRVREAHLLWKDHTEFAYYYLSEMTNSSKSLTLRSFRQLLQEYNPQIDGRVSTGGTFLVELCRAKNTSKTVILKCVQEIAQRRQQHSTNWVNQTTYESPRSQLTALTVAATRAMPNVVRYLLSLGADTTILCSGRFALGSSPRSSIQCQGATALQFATTMLQAEEERADSTTTRRQLQPLRTCIQLLTNHHSDLTQKSSKQQQQDE